MLILVSTLALASATFATVIVTTGTSTPRTVLVPKEKVVIMKKIKVIGIGYVNCTWTTSTRER